MTPKSGAPGVAVGRLDEPRAPAALTRAVAALDAARVPAAVLRDFEAGEAPFVEVDLLVERGARRRLRAALVQSGYEPLRAWGHGSHRFFLTYSRAERRWVKLDVLTRLRGADVVHALSRRRRAGGLPRLPADVEAALLLLHVVLDRGGHPGRHGPRLRRAAAEPPPPAPGAPQALKTLWPQLWSAVAGGDERALEGLAGAARAATARRGDRPRERLRRWLRRAHYLRRAFAPVVPTVLVVGREAGVRVIVADGVADCLPPPVRRIRVEPGPLAQLRLLAAIELARRRSSGPVVIDAGVASARFARVDVAIRPTAGRQPVDASPQLVDEVSRAAWRAYSRRL